MSKISTNGAFSNIGSGLLNICFGAVKLSAWALKMIGLIIVGVVTGGIALIIFFKNK